ncbi:MAG TPA: hypothetical protein VIM33_08760 [Gaiellaceae bacterium]|jgi:hypothetical protein
MSTLIDAPPEAERPAESAPLPDKIVVKLGGVVVLDRNDPSDAALFRRLELGEDVSVQVEGRVARRAESQVFDREGERVGVKVEAAVSVHAIYAPAGG